MRLERRLALLLAAAALIVLAALQSFTADDLTPPDEAIPLVSGAPEGTP